jgi:hypothetical protein
MLDAVLRPGLQAFEEWSTQFLKGGERELRKRVFAGEDFVVLQFNEVDDAKMDLADGIGVVVDEGDDGLRVAAIEVKFLGQFTGNCSVVGGSAGATVAGVHRIDVAADADGDLGVKAALPTRAAASVMKNAVAVADHAVSDELLVGRVFFSCGAVHEEVVRRIEKAIHRVLDTLGAEAMKDPGFLKQCTWHYQYFFARVFRHRGEHSDGQASAKRIGCFLTLPFGGQATPDFYHE